MGLGMFPYPFLKQFLGSSNSAYEKKIVCFWRSIGALGALGARASFFWVNQPKNVMGENSEQKKDAE